MSRIQHAKHIAAGAVRCLGCRGHIGRHQYDRGKPCTSCQGQGYVYRSTPEGAR